VSGLAATSLTSSSEKPIHLCAVFWRRECSI
jgi:hypothetical protein